MDPRLLSYYNRELGFVREMGAEFAREYPKIAGRLGLDGFECADPYVERLLEGFAFLAARVQLKLDAQYPVFTQHLMEMLYPQYLRPIPSMAVVQLHPDPKAATLATGHAVPRGTALRAIPGADMRTACEFRTAHATTLWPLELAGVTYFETPAALAAAGIVAPEGADVRGGLRLSLRTTGGIDLATLPIGALPVFLAGNDERPKRLYEHLFADAEAVLVRGEGAQAPVQVWLGSDSIRPRGFDDDDALLPVDGRSFSGFRLLQEYFACPERFLFAEFDGLKPALQRMRGQAFEIVVLMRRSVPVLARGLDTSHLRLFCTPAINLFPRTGDRIHLRPESTEYHVVADRVRPMDFEVFGVTRVEGFGDRQEPEVRFHPFYGGDTRTWHAREGAYYTLRREPRLLSGRQRRQGARSSYVGSEVFLSLVDAGERALDTPLRQVGLQLLCGNRDLPLHMPVGKSATDFQLDAGVPVAQARCVAGPTRPRPAMAGGETAWRLLSHLQFDYLSLFEGDPASGAAALRELLSLYCDPNDAAALRQVEGVKSIASRTIVRRLPVPGPITFGRGLEITLTCDDGAFEGTGAYLIGAVLQHFFARYASINGFTETVLRTLERQHVARWPARPGLRQVA
ncbi:type VI secretion system baseplate subunit TssF [Luteimonas deserti]|uniref:Type VI secretion system baseplate subunit TssF n=1 Tax=Luteimonas deserti TaxID=2752306 RepID=A0A7Z0QWE2_9GAMM|nr:type VI secretion system baseplate subunit TssF [Luteimonas deserti]NYZ64285.1 type VI secretion system baseplate subunit TssF [Luteimonas deserti]